MPRKAALVIDPSKIRVDKRARPLDECRHPKWATCPVCRPDKYPPIAEPASGDWPPRGGTDSLYR